MNQIMKVPQLIYLLSFAASLVLMLCLTPPLRKLAYKIDYTEKPKSDDRKIHNTAKPYLAGVGMFVTFWVLYAVFVRDFSRGHAAHLCGVADDLRRRYGGRLV